METWLNDNVPVPGEVFREFVKYLYQQNLLVQNRLTVGRHTVDLKRITCPVLNLMALRDDLVPPAQSQPFNDLVGSQDKESITLPTGHIGLRWVRRRSANSGRARFNGWSGNRKTETPRQVLLLAALVERAGANRGFAAVLGNRSRSGK
jgi:poly(3-hydroxyalkanoate) synthetase